MTSTVAQKKSSVPNKITASSAAPTEIELRTVDVNDSQSVAMALDDGVREYFATKCEYEEDNTLSNIRLSLAAISIFVCLALQIFPINSFSNGRAIMLLTVGVFIVLQAVYSLVTVCMQGAVIFQGKPNTKKNLPRIEVSTTKKEKYAEEFSIHVKSDKVTLEQEFPVTQFFSSNGVFITDNLYAEMDKYFSIDKLNGGKETNGNGKEESKKKK